jgi:dTDP-L-rhamnose 4-epimerase
MKRVLITGGAGFIGRHVAHLLLEEGIDVRILDPLSAQVHGAIPVGLDWLERPGVEFIRGSVTDRNTVEAAIHNIDVIVHLAAETGTGQSMYDIARYNSANCQGTAILMDILVSRTDIAVSRVVLASSRSVYGEGAYNCDVCNDQAGRIFPSARSAAQLEAHQWEHVCKRCGSDLRNTPSRESDPRYPASIYAATKCAQEDLVRISCGARGIDYAILRLQNVYGEGQSLANPYTGLISIFSTRIRRNMELPVFEDGRETRDFIHVDDVAKAFLACVKRPERLSRTVNIGSGIATSILDVASCLNSLLNGHSELRITSEYRLGDIRHNVADTGNYRELVPGGAQISLEAGLNRFAKWVKAQPLAHDRLDVANSELRRRKLMP